MAILIFFVLHWQLSVFFQSFFHHRYGAHRQFEMSKGWERFFHVCAVVAQGSSYMSPRAYAIMHRAHHAYSDTAKDPHSPHFYPNVASMMWSTVVRYEALLTRKEEPESRFDGGYPEWPLMEKLAENWVTRIGWGVLYTAFYVAFAPSPWFYLLLPVHFLMGPLHGSIVNWCGHKYGYRNFAAEDKSRNTLVVDVLCAGELFQNNHHAFGQSPNFAAKWFEIDPTYQVMKLLHALRIIDMSGATLIPTARLKAPQASEA